MSRLCVFCGSSPGRRAEYRDAARALGRLLAQRGIGLVYGGGGGGLMGVLAEAVLEGGGEAIGVIPHALEKRELAHRGLTELRVVDSMHERKALMASLADGFVALPGGAGTLEEICEVWTWGLLGVHRKPCGIINTAGYYTPLLEFIDRMVAEEFLAPGYRDMLVVAPDAASLLDRFDSYRHPAVEGWITRETT